MNDTERMKQQLTRKKKVHKISRRDWLSSGSTLLNLACSGNVRRGFLKGKYYWLVGDSESGKTFLSLTCLAEASINSNFDDYRFIYDDVEGGALMDLEKFFGRKVAERLESPGSDEEGRPVTSSTAEEFYYHVDDAIEDGRPFIYVLDSMDALSSAQEQDKFQETKTAYRKGTSTTGSYGDGKAKKNSSGIRQLLPHLRRSGSILIIISQTRDNLGFGFENKTVSGGRAPKFYATLQIWSSVVGQIKKTVKGKPRHIGSRIKVVVKKNRQTGQHPPVKIVFYHSYGIDDLESCVDFLVEEGHWKKKGARINADEFDLCATKEKIIQHVEANGEERQLRRLVQQTWDEIQEAMIVQRKKRYE